MCRAPHENLPLPCYHLRVPWGLLVIVLIIIAVYLVAGVVRYLRQWLQPDRPDDGEGRSNPDSKRSNVHSL